MPESFCPGQDLSKWRPDDIVFTACTSCGTEIEIWKDEPQRICPKCHQEVRNPRIDLGCAKWCASAEQCLERLRANPPKSSVTKDERNRHDPC